ncbi:hypothetical protein V8E36_000980 [Tilletia maclaganii]
MSDPNFPATGLQIKPSNAQIEGGDEWDVVDSVEDIQSFGIAGRVWEAAYAARTYFTAMSEPSNVEVDPVSSLFSVRQDSRQINILELGAGAGYGGLHLAKCLASHRRRQCFSEATPRPRVLLTDLPNVQPLLQRNIAKAQDADTELVQQVQAEAWPCAWGDRSQADDILNNLQREGTSLTHILAADLVYFPELFPPLLRSLIWLTQPSSGQSSAEVIFTYKVRSLIKEQPFWAVFGAWFDFEPVLCRARASDAGERPTTTPWRRFGERASDIQLRPSKSAAVKDAGIDLDDQQVYVFLARRRPHTLDWNPPETDQRLMSGRRERRNAATGCTETVSELDDTFETLLFNSMDL